MSNTIGNVPGFGSGYWGFKSLLTLMFYDFIFYFFAVAAVYTALKVITSTNPVNSVWYLVMVFGNVTVLIFSLGVEYLGIILWIIYVGAIAILFIFVLKLLNIRLVELRDNATRYVPVGLMIGLVLYYGLRLPVNHYDSITVSTYTNVAPFSNMENLGLILFDDLGILLILAGYILLLAMVGAIVLTLGHEGEVKRQDIFEQVSRQSIVVDGAKA